MSKKATAMYSLKLRWIRFDSLDINFPEFHAFKRLIGVLLFYRLKCRLWKNHKNICSQKYPQKQINPQTQ